MSGCFPAGIIEGLNQAVDGDDDVLVLGDLALGKIADTLGLAAELKGRKILVAGNRDRCWARHGGATTWSERYIEGGFAEVYQGTVRLRIGAKICEREATATTTIASASTDPPTLATGF